MKNISWLGICFAVCGGFIAVDAAAVSPGVRGGLGGTDTTQWGKSSGSKYVDVLNVGGKKYGCGLIVKSQANYNYNYGDVLQTLGGAA